MYIPVWVGASTLGIRLSIASTNGTATCNNFVISEKKKQEKSIAYSQESQVCFQFVSYLKTWWGVKIYSLNTLVKYLGFTCHRSSLGHVKLV